MSQIDDKSIKTLLSSLNLDEFSSKIYEYLLQSGEQKPGTISKVLDIKRPTAYKALYNLEDLGLIGRNMDLPEVHFRAKGPQQLKLLIEKQRKKVDKLWNNYLEILPAMTELYEQNYTAPIIQTLFGLTGLKQIHIEIETTAKEVLLIRSVIDRLDEKVTEEIDRHVAKRGEIGIRTKILTPALHTTNATLQKYPGIPGREMRFVDQEKLGIETQIMLYNNKIVITNYRNELVSLIIQQEHIFNSFKQIFENLWDQNKK